MKRVPSLRPHNWLNVALVLILRREQSEISAAILLLLPTMPLYSIMYIHNPMGRIQIQYSSYKIFSNMSIRILEVWPMCKTIDEANTRSNSIASIFRNFYSWSTKEKAVVSLDRQVVHHGHFDPG